MAGVDRNDSLPCCATGLVCTARALHAPHSLVLGDMMALRPVAGVLG